jgi:hypothetical protein
MSLCLWYGSGSGKSEPYRRLLFLPVLGDIGELGENVPDPVCAGGMVTEKSSCGIVDLR